MKVIKLLLEDIIKCADQGLNYSATSKLLGVNRSSVRKFAIKHRDEFLELYEYLLNN